MATASVGLVALGIVSALIWQVWQEQQRTAKEKENFGESFRLLNRADGMIMAGMGQMAMAATATRSPEGQKRAEDFYREADAFYDRLTKEPSTSPRVQALAFRRLGFTRMVWRRDMRAAEDYRRSIALYESLLAADPHDAELRDGLADVHYSLGLLLLDSRGGGISRSEPSFRTAVHARGGAARLRQETPSCWSSLPFIGSNSVNGWRIPRNRSRRNASVVKSSISSSA